MSQFAKGLELGFRWIRCGARLFRRNPWLMVGMGACATVSIAVLTRLPFIGPPIISLLVPALLASFMLTLDKMAQQKVAIAPAHRFGMLKQAPREMLQVFRDESRAVQVVMMSFYCMAAVVLTDIIVYFLFGSVWGNRNTDMQTLPRLIAATVVLLALYAVIAASLIYTLPLSLFERMPLVPAMQRSLAVSRRHFVALLAPATLLLVPVLIVAAGSAVFGNAAYIMGIVAGVILLPVIAACFYCSYRTMFQMPESPRAVQQVRKDRRVRAA